MYSPLNPTYQVAPNWTFLPGGPIALGNIIFDPLRPHRVLSKPPHAATTIPPKTITATENNWKLESETIRSFNVSLWTRLFDMVGLHIGTHHREAASGTFIMDSIDTVYFAEEPSLEDIQLRVQEPRVSAILRADSRLRGGTVYMVTGLKIARAFRLTHKASDNKGANIGALIQATPEALPMDGSMTTSTQTNRSDGFLAANDIIFAYQLLRIRPKGFRNNKTLEIDEYQSAAAFLSNDKSEEEDGVIDVEIDLVGLEDLIKSQEGVKEFDLDDSQDAWLFPRE